ncbi:hypothetical protein ABEB36_012947 [Hypothenemus hampei]|uniref:Uncharacterized protein n=1 Tax=Hypothenemus hampei TaxID=57062 RepID=A0ABD1E8D8_HYPHA
MVVTGICLFNESIFGEEEFLSSYVTDRPQDSPNNATVDNYSINIQGEESSEEETVENLKLNDSSSDENLEQFFGSIREEAESEELGDQSIKERDFVLVQLATKKTKRYYVAKVIKKVEDGFEVQFYKKIPGTTASRNFIPSDESPSFIFDSDVTLHLPPPKSVGSSKRQEAQLPFAIDFDTSFNIM